MRGFVILAAAAAIATLPAPAGAQRGGPSSSHHGAFSNFSQFASPTVRSHRDRPDRRDRRDRRDFRGDAYFPYRDYQGDSLWRSDSFNDWWHDRPHRSLPRWVHHNQNCERQYWAGGGWRC